MLGGGNCCGAARRIELRHAGALGDWRRGAGITLGAIAAGVLLLRPHRLLAPPRKPCAAAALAPAPPAPQPIPHRHHLSAAQPSGRATAAAGVYRRGDPAVRHYAGSRAVQTLLQLPVLIFQHANVRLPGVVPIARIAWLISTPAMHLKSITRAGARDQQHYATGLTLWDRLFGSFNSASAPRRSA